MNAGVFRVVSIAKALHRAGWAIDVVAGPPGSRIPQEGYELARSLPAEVTIHRWTHPSLQPIDRFAPTIHGGFLEIERILEVARRLRLPNVILASGPKFSEFVAAWVLGATTGIPYVLDYRDEWTENPAAFIRRGLTDRFWERLAIAGAAEIICVTPGMARHYGQVFHRELRREPQLIPNGWDASDPPIESAPDGDDGVLTVGFFGSLIEETAHIEFDRLFDTLEAVARFHPDLAHRVRFTFVGLKWPPVRERLAREPLRPICVDVDSSSQSEAQQAMRRCAALLLLNGRDAGRVLPSKTFEYLAARRPILVYGLGGDVAATIGALPGTRMIPADDPEALKLALDELLSGSVDRELMRRDPRLVDEHSRSVRSTAIVRLLERVAFGVESTIAPDLERGANGQPFPPPS